MGTGVGAVPLNIDGGIRVGPGGAFLQPALGRPTADLMADPAATIELVERATSSDKRVELVEGGYHALLRDLEREHTMDTIIEWIDERRRR